MPRASLARSVAALSSFVNNYQAGPITLLHDAYICDYICTRSAGSQVYHCIVHSVCRYVESAEPRQYLDGTAVR